MPIGEEVAPAAIGWAFSAAAGHLDHRPDQRIGGGPARRRRGALAAPAPRRPRRPRSTIGIRIRTRRPPTPGIARSCGSTPPRRPAQPDAAQPERARAPAAIRNGGVLSPPKSSVRTVAIAAGEQRQHRLSSAACWASLGHPSASRNASSLRSRPTPSAPASSAASTSATVPALASSAGGARPASPPDQPLGAGAPPPRGRRRSAARAARGLPSSIPPQTRPPVRVHRQRSPSGTASSAGPDPGHEGNRQRAGDDRGVRGGTAPRERDPGHQPRRIRPRRPAPDPRPARSRQGRLGRRA